MSIARNLEQTKAELAPFNCTLIAVSKTKPNEAIIDAYQAGHRDFGENKVQELVRKHEELPPDIQWHMIGHLQRNKVKYIAGFVHLIHGVDSAKLLSEIDKQGKKHKRIIHCLLQVHIAEESTKFGFSETELTELLNSDVLDSMENVQIDGLMGMATFTDDLEQVSREFQSLKELYDRIQSGQHPSNVNMSILSMGMSGDYKIAMKEGSNMVRIGTAIFGERNYG